MPHALVDGFGRRVTNLRISLTDRCNFRCVYCMPPEGVPLLPKSTFLAAKEIVRFVRVIGRLGVGRIRLTGGEPLLRKDVVDIVRCLHEIPAVEDLSVTTNGSRLGELAAPLREAGLDRINISLDSLDPARFAEVTLYPDFARVRRGIEAALDVGFPVKINVVVMTGLADCEILDFVRMTADGSLEVRFLEFMPLCGTGWRPELVYPIERVRALVERHFDLEPLYRGSDPAETFTVAGGRGRVGFIAPLSEPFCASCARIRISADGRIRPCLFSDVEYSVADVLRAGASDAALTDAIRHAVSIKPAGSQFAEDPFRAGHHHDTKVNGPVIRSIGG